MNRRARVNVPRPARTVSPSPAAEPGGMIEGKGYFVWRAHEVLSRPGMSSPQDAAQKARVAGIEHVVVKIADGDQPFPDPTHDFESRNESATTALVAALRAEGITVWGWAFVYGDGAEPEAQAKMLAQRARQLSMNGLVIDAEDVGEQRWSIPGGATRARQYMHALRGELAGVDGLILAFSSYRFPSHHPSFPFAAFMEDCDVALPQVYWVTKGEGDAISTLRRSYQEYRERFPSKLYIPVGAAYGEEYSDGGRRYFWSASPQQIHRFMDQARALGLPAVTFWSWEHALHDLDNQRYNGSELWDAVAVYDFCDVGEGVGGAPTEEEDVELQVQVGDPHYRDGLYPQFPHAAFIPMVHDGQPMKYARTVSSTASSVWALWRPDIEESGHYDVSVWVPGQNATTRSAQYQIHGIVGEKKPVIVEVNQDRFSNAWVSLGVYELDADNPMSGQVNLTNHTDEERRWIAFAAVRWQKVSPVGAGDTRLADGFDPPVGTEEERRAADLWPGDWTDANTFGNYYRLRDSYYYHTGADLNLNEPAWDSDRGKPVFAAASGDVTFAGRRRHWGNVIVICHDPLEPGGSVVYSRYAHLGRLDVRRGQRVQRGQQIGTVGQDEYGGPFHLHFDISPTEVLYNDPGDWPGLDRRRLFRDYVDPGKFISENRPV